MKWLASYPKSGNTWVRMFLNAYVTGEALDINAKRQQFVISDFQTGIHPPYADLDDQIRYYPVSITKLRGYCVKTHNANVLGIIPIKETANSIYLVRDPRDVAISLANHYGTTVDDAIKFMNEPNAIATEKNTGFSHILRTWSEHVESWGCPQITYFRYEDLLKHTADAFKMILEILEVPLTNNFDFALKQSNFNNLQDLEKKNGFIEKASEKRVFFREGKAGQWKETLTLKQVKTIEENHCKIMTKIGYLNG